MATRNALQHHFHIVGIESGTLNVNDGTGVRFCRLGQNGHCSYSIGVLFFEFRDGSKLQRTHGACRHASRLLTIRPQFDARIAFNCLAKLFVIRRHAIRTRLHAVLTPDALRIIVLHGSIRVVNVHGPVRTRRHACGRFAMVARRGMMIYASVWIFPHLKVAHVPEQQTNAKVIFIFARDLACLASDTCRLIEVVTHLCHTSPFVAAIIARHQRQSRTRRTEALPSLASINSMKRGIVPSCPRTRATMQAWLESPIPLWSDFGWWGGPVLTMDSRGYSRLFSSPEPSRLRLCLFHSLRIASKIVAKAASAARVSRTM